MNFQEKLDSREILLEVKRFVTTQSRENLTRNCSGGQLT